MIKIETNEIVYVLLYENALKLVSQGRKGLEFRFHGEVLIRNCLQDARSLIAAKPHIMSATTRRKRNREQRIARSHTSEAECGWRIRISKRPKRCVQCTGVEVIRDGCARRLCVDSKYRRVACLGTYRV